MAKGDFRSYSLPYGTLPRTIFPPRLAAAPAHQANPTAAKQPTTEAGIGVNVTESIRCPDFTHNVEPSAGTARRTDPSS
ncbi:hypothetical protein VTN96DRAFT_8669 [Rasamsonia emersonii]